MSNGLNSLKMDKKNEEISEKKQRLPRSKSEKKFTLALEPFLVEIVDHCLDINQEHEVPRSLIFTWQNSLEDISKRKQCFPMILYQR